MHRIGTPPGTTEPVLSGVPTSFEGSALGCSRVSGGETVTPEAPGDGVPETVETEGAPVQLFNPLGTNVTIPEFIGRGVRAVVGVIGAIALLMFVYGGIMWMTAGSSDRVKTAKDILKNSIIGILLIFFSYSLISIFFDLFAG